MSRAAKIIQANEARPYRPHLQNDHYHQKSEAELHYIIKDASAAAKAMQGHNPEAEGKYLDQANDAATVLGYRRRGGKQETPS